jgi:hypothetical protein
MVYSGEDLPVAVKFGLKFKRDQIILFLTKTIKC